MITLCLACHAKVTRTQYLKREWPPLLRLLWREQHPRSHEQTALDFTEMSTLARRVLLFGDEQEQNEARDAFYWTNAISHASLFPAFSGQRHSKEEADLEASLCIDRWPQGH